MGQTLRAWIADRGINSSLFFWRTPAGAEVDFILYGSDRFMAIEVKTSANGRHNYIACAEELMGEGAS